MPQLMPLMWIFSNCMIFMMVLVMIFIMGSYSNQLMNMKIMKKEIKFMWYW